jgi:hypothetical protein
MNKFLLLVFLAYCYPSWAENAMQFKIVPASPERNFVRQAIQNGQYEIFASGEIDAEASTRFEKFVNDNSIDNAIVIFDSPGGSLIGGLKLGSLIRNLYFDTAIGLYGVNGHRIFEGLCASSCAYAFAGGAYRYFYDGKEKLGIHQFYSSNQNIGDVGDTQVLSSVLIAYLQDMGINAKAFVMASSARGNEMFWLTQQQAEQLGFANNGSFQTTAEIKMSGLTPYLKIEQNHNEVMARVLFNCESHKVVISAGIVTTPELSQAKRAGLVRNYLETTPGDVLLEQKGDALTYAVDSVLWLRRALSRSDLTSILKADSLGIWTENGGPMRWGAMIDLRSAKEKMLYFAKNCVITAQ